MSDQENPSTECKNTDRHLWPQVSDDLYSPRVFATGEDGIGIDVGGHVIVKPVQEWHRAAAEIDRLREQLVTARKALETIEREDRMWTPFPGGREVLDRSYTGNVKIRHRYGQIAHDALSSLSDEKST